MIEPAGPHAGLRPEGEPVGPDVPRYTIVAPQFHRGDGREHGVVIGPQACTNILGQRAREGFGFLSTILDDAEAFGVTNGIVRGQVASYDE